MSEETQPVQVEQPTSGQENGTGDGTAAEAKPVEDTRPAWVREIESAPAEDLRKHDRISGIIGSELATRQEAWRQQWEAEQRAQIDAEARETAKRELKELYDKNPLEYADRKAAEDEAREAAERLRSLETNARHEVSKRVGAAFHDIPEWQQVVNDPAEFATLMQAIQGKSDDEVIPAWNRAATDAVARIRAKNLAESTFSERIVKEKAAWEEEAAARGLVTSTRPDISRGGRTVTLDPEPHPGTKAWDLWYERTTPGAKRTARG